MIKIDFTEVTFFTTVISIYHGNFGFTWGKNHLPQSKNH